ncbi:Putative calcium-binding protein CML19 [Linum grandiflorum]
MDKQEQYKRVFADFDSDGDGKISCSELRLCVGGDSLTEEEAEAAVRYSDSDGDGMLDLEDFVRLVEAGDEDDKVQDLREAFKMYAAGDQNGKMITPKSLKKMLSRLGMRRSTAECGVMIAEFDVNGDGFLDFDEFKVMMS